MFAVVYLAFDKAALAFQSRYSTYLPSDDLRAEYQSKQVDEGLATLKPRANRANIMLAVDHKLRGQGQAQGRPRTTRQPHCLHIIGMAVILWVYNMLLLALLAYAHSSS